MGGDRYRGRWTDEHIAKGRFLIVFKKARLLLVIPQGTSFHCHYQGQVLYFLSTRRRLLILINKMKFFI